MLFPKLRLKKRQKQVKQIDEKNIKSLVHDELDGYIKKEDLQKYLADIQKDEHKRKIWNSLSSSKKLSLLRYLARKGQHEKVR